MKPKKVELSNVDRKILTYMKEHGTTNHSKIARALNLNPLTVNYKIKKLEENKIIIGYNYRLSPFKLGLTYMDWCMMNFQKNARFKTIFRELIKYPNVVSLSAITGEFDLLLKFFHPDAVQLNEFLINIGKKYKNDISRISTVFVTKPYKLHHTIIKDRKAVKLNKKDLALLEYKLNNPSASLLKCADALNMHRNTASQRWKRLWKEEVILKKAPKIDPAYLHELGIGFKAYLYMNVQPGEIERFVSQIINLPEIHELTSISYTFDLLALVRTKDTLSCHNFIQDLYKTKILEKTKTAVVFDGNEILLRPADVRLISSPS